MTGEKSRSDYVDESVVSEFAARLVTAMTETPINAEDQALGIVERLKRAYAATAFGVTDADGDHYSSKMYQPLEKRLLATAPTTTAGAVAVLGYVIDLMETDQEGPPENFYDDLEIGLVKSVRGALTSPPLRDA